LVCAASVGESRSVENTYFDAIFALELVEFGGVGLAMLLTPASLVVWVVCHGVGIGLVTTEGVG